MSFNNDLEQYMSDQIELEECNKIRKILNERNIILNKLYEQYISDSNIDR
jgi:hypothetical protein